MFLFKKEKQYPLGAIRAPLDFRRVKISQVQEPVKYPDRFWNTKVADLSVFNQKNIGSCTGQSQAFIDKVLNYKETSKIIDLSPRYPYGMAKKIDGYAGEGTNPDIVSKVNIENGCATQSTLINNCDLTHAEYIGFNETEEMKADAYPYRIKGYVEVPADLDSIQSALYQNEILGATISVGNYSNPIKKGKNGYHRIALFGYGYKGLRIRNGKIEPYGKKKGRILIVNSWGPEWGVLGFGWIDIDKSGLYDVRAYIDIPNEILEQNKNKSTLRITRSNSDSKQTLGEFIASFNGNTISGKTLELLWDNNKPNKSCIPTGTYVCKWEYSKYFKTYVFRVYGVNGRVGIMGHPGNFYTDILGCILFGSDFKDINSDGELDVISSRLTLQRIYLLFKGQNFTLIIK